MKRSLLELAQEISSSLDSEEFNSIDEIITFATEHLLGTEMGVKVRLNEQNKSEVHHTMSLANVEAKLLASVEADA